MRNEPSYPITSVDHALHLAIVLQHESPLRVSDAAERLGVSPSTAHRLLAMLVYRGFAEQRPDRRYQAGDALRPAIATHAPVALLRQVARPHMESLVERVQESVNLMVLAGTETRFIASAECVRTLRVGSREGRTLPAHLTSGGNTLLAALPPDKITALYEGRADIDLTRLRRELTLARKRGFAINAQRTEAGLTAIAVPVRSPEDPPIAAVALALPSARFHRDRVPEWVSALSDTAAAIAHGTVEAGLAG